MKITIELETDESADEMAWTVYKDDTFLIFGTVAPNGTIILFQDMVRQSLDNAFNDLIGMNEI